MDAMETLLKFVSGELDKASFKDALYYNPAVEELLSDPTVNWNGTYVDAFLNLYCYLLEQDYDRAGEIGDAIDAVELFLQKKGIEYTRKPKGLDIYGFMLDSQPSYIDCDSKFFEKHIMPKNRDMPKAELKKATRENFNAYFKYQSKPPKWIQNPAWPIRGDKPLFFVGQIELKNDALHDDGMVYVFFDSVSGEIETVTQLY